MAKRLDAPIFPSQQFFVHHQQVGEKTKPGGEKEGSLSGSSETSDKKRFYFCGRTQGTNISHPSRRIDPRTTEYIQVFM